MYSISHKLCRTFEYILSFHKNAIKQIQNNDKFKCIHVCVKFRSCNIWQENLEHFQINMRFLRPRVYVKLLSVFLRCYSYKGMCCRKKGDSTDLRSAIMNLLKDISYTVKFRN